MTGGLEVASAALSLASAALDGLNKLTSSSAISNKVAAQLGVESDLAFIRDEFAMMRAFLKTADGAKKAKRGGKVITTWVRQVRVLAYDVEDCLADSAMHLDRRQSWSCSCLPRSIKARHRIAGEIKKLRARVEDVSNRNLRYRLINDDAGPSQPASSIGSAGEADYYERSSEARLTDLLISNNGGGHAHALQVISVWGCDADDRASVSVVRDAYENPETKKSFTWSAWVKMEHPFNRNEFVKSLLMHFYTNSVQDPAGGMEAIIEAEKKMMENSIILHKEFQRLATENKYLFVPDDLDDAEVLLWIKKCLPCHQNGSRIIVCTQHLGIAMLCPEQPIQLAESKLNELLAGHPPIYLLFQKGLQNGRSDTTLEPEEGQYNSGDTRKHVNELISAALEESSLIGRDSDAQKVIEFLQNANSQEYIVVYGVDGIGKTALVKSICQREKLSRMFERIAWFPVEDTFNPEEFNRTDMGSSKGNLLVLHDVSSMKQLNPIKPALRKAHNISRVIIITKEPDVAKSYTKCYELKPLEHKDALDLFKKKVKVNLCDKKKLLAPMIVDKCDRNPHAINIVASYLQKANVNEWQRFYDHLCNKEVKGIKSILSAIYMSLPYNLKSCFLYLSVFPKDREIRRRRLIRRWIAEGYSSEDKGTAAKYVAEKQFQGLINKNMIQPSGITISKIGNNGETYHFEFKNLMHEISRKKSAEENLVLILDEHEHSTTFQGKSKARHLTIMSGWSRERMKSNTLDSKLDLSCIRSLTVFGECKSFFISKKMKKMKKMSCIRS